METLREETATADQNSGKRPRVRKNVTAALAEDICSEKYPVGAQLPRENDLCEIYGVSRTVIRESIKVLESKGMLRVKPRVGTVVTDREDWNILDGEVLDWIGPFIHEFDLLGCILEARRTIEPAAAEFAAKRATLQEIAALEAAWLRMRDSNSDPEAFTEADVDFHSVLMAASHNQVFRRLSSAIHTALHYTLHASNTAVESRDLAIELHGELVDALRLRDAPRAREASNRMLDLAEHDLTAAQAAAGRVDR
ncbi:FadR/GntR family transcriptional regulator [Roseibium sp. ROS1]|uniref:HTH-type transcriptional regulator Mce2R n=1 Tax=Roseibium aggregatum TaxID=187304 RepID=A0A0M6Y3J8_9HYPH|nr:HTH-type transcriptional regulator Mce2R [Roseibium aggregatum]